MAQRALSSYKIDVSIRSVDLFPFLVLTFSPEGARGKRNRVTGQGGEVWARGPNLFTPREDESLAHVAKKISGSRSILTHAHHGRRGFAFLTQYVLV